MSSNEAMIIPFFKKKEGKKPSSIFYSSASVTSASSSICNSAFEWGLTSHGGWPSRFESEIAVIAVELVVSDSDFGSRGRATEVTPTGDTLKTM